MKRLVAFTLLEVIVVISIILILAAIAFPVFQRATASVKVTATQQNLHQQYLAFKIYQDSNDGSAVYGYWNQMGYPPPDRDWPRMLDPSLNIWKSPCGCHPSWPCPVTVSYRYWWPSAEHPYAAAFGENLVLFSDEHCNDHSVEITNNFQKRRGVGILLGGQIKNIYKVGDIRKFSWWAEPSTPIVE